MHPLSSHSPSPLQGIHVLDAARVLAGPYCGQLLADLGAEVVKLERPGHGDDTRGWGPPYHGDVADNLSAYFLSCNRNKRSLTLDVAHPESKEVLNKLLARTDVLIENFRSDSAVKLGLAPKQILADHPHMIICSISGYGRTGPLAEVPGYDFAIQALSGLMNITGPVEGPPFKVGVAVVDVLTGLYAATAILACLWAREQSGHGYAIDLSLHDCALAAQVNVAQAYLTSGKLPDRQGNAHLQIVPYQLFATADGWLVLNVGNDGQWQAFCKAAEEPTLGEDARYLLNRQRVEQRQELVPQIEAIMKRHKSAEWVTRLSAAKVPHAEVRNYTQVFADEQNQYRGMMVTVRDLEGKPVDLVGNPFKIEGAIAKHPTMPPKLGQHTDEILRELGISDELRSQLRERGAI